ncbi:hypothetical protein OROGR_002146 [Orobanche gracilis]
MLKSPWGKIGNWAAEAERAEAEEREAAEKAAAYAAVHPPAIFPSSKEAVTTGKQKKKTKMTLAIQQSTYSGSAPNRGLTPEEMLRLPTGPKERSADEMQYGRLGGGFSNYGSRTGSGGSNTGRGREYEGRRSYGFDEDNRRGTPPESRVSDFNQHSRADEVGNWASMKKQTLPEYHSHKDRPGGKYSSLGGGGGLGVASRADEVYNWASGKKSFPQTQQSRSSSFGSGFSRPEPNHWARNDQSFGSGFSRPEPDRRTGNEQGLIIDSPKNDDVMPKVNRPDPFGTARPREEVLAEKGLDWKKLDLDIEVKKQHLVSGGSRPSSSQSSRPGSQHSSRSDVPVALGIEGVVNEETKVNPFGNAKPREVLLEEKGKKLILSWSVDRLIGYEARTLQIGNFSRVVSPCRVLFYV